MQKGKWDRAWNSLYRFKVNETKHDKYSNNFGRVSTKAVILDYSIKSLAGLKGKKEMNGKQSCDLADYHLILL